jgi:ribosomal protein L7/L12
MSVKTIEILENLKSLTVLADAEELKQQLEAAGATVSLK